jgi:hypothetical protein
MGNCKEVSFLRHHQLNDSSGKRSAIMSPHQVPWVASGRSQRGEYDPIGKDGVTPGCLRVHVGLSGKYSFASLASKAF